nr:BamA/TamA family outer membrane protein [Saprospiraceae bacterium]
MIKYAIFLLLLGILSSCGVKKYIPEEERLFTGVDVSVETESSVRDIKEIESELVDIIRPQPNTSILGGRPYLRWHYRANSEKSNFINRFLNKRFGEEPVYLSDVNLERNGQVILNRMENKGFFNSEIHFETDTSKRKKARISFKIQSEEPYHLKNYQIEGMPTQLSNLAEESMTQSLLQEGMRYNLTSLRRERNRISDYLMEHGYYYFTGDYLLFSMDTALGDRQFNLYLQIKPNVPEEALQPYKISDIFVYPDQALPSESPSARDTVHMDNYQVISSTHQFKPGRLDDYILFDKGELYRKSQSDITRQRLFAIGAFGFVNIRHRKPSYSPPDTLDYNYLESHIYLSPVSKISLRAELQAISKSNNFMGPVMTGEYRDRNAFKGGEQFQLGMKLGYETQVAGGRQTGLSAFEIGVYGELSFPRIIAPIKWRDNIHYGVPRTRIKLSYSILSRLNNYELRSAVFSFGYSWNGSRYAHHEIKPVSISYTRLSQTSEQFEEVLMSNPFLQRSFQQQFIPGIEYNFTFHNKSTRDKKHHQFVQFRADAAGNFAHFMNRTFEVSEQQKIFGNEFAQYLRFDLDMRHYISLGKESQFVARVFGGLGLPQGESLSLPYIKQYFSGGPNSVRAFRIRSLGPGTYQPQDLNDRSFFDQAGDIRVEANIEYRFPLISYLKGALFADGGNIWLANDNETLPGGQFSSDWVRELAVGAGFGFRLDIDLFVIRLDIATPLRKPWLEEGNRWVDNFSIGKKEWRRENIVYNIAIGYPF